MRASSGTRIDRRDALGEAIDLGRKGVKALAGRDAMEDFLRDGVEAGFGRSGEQLIEPLHDRLLRRCLARLGPLLPRHGIVRFGAAAIGRGLGGVCRRRHWFGLGGRRFLRLIDCAGEFLDLLPQFGDGAGERTVVGGAAVSAAGSRWRGSLPRGGFVDQALTFGDLGDGGVEIDGAPLAGRCIALRLWRGGSGAVGAAPGLGLRRNGRLLGDRFERAFNGCFACLFRGSARLEGIDALADRTQLVFGRALIDRRRCRLFGRLGRCLFDGLCAGSRSRSRSAAAISARLVASCRSACLRAGAACGAGAAATAGEGRLGCVADDLSTLP